MKTKVSFLGLISVLLLSLIAGCGGGGGDSAATSTTSTTDTVSGVAAAGTALVGKIYLKDSSNPAREISKDIAADGSFSFDVTSLAPPFLLKAVGTANGNNYTLYSVATDKGTANVNPMTHLVVANAAGGAGPKDIYDVPQQAKVQAMIAQLPQALQDIKTSLKSLLKTHNIENINPISDVYTVNHKGLDGMLDVVKIEISNKTVTITNTVANAVIFTASADKIKDGKIDETKIPQPQTTTVVSGTGGTGSSNTGVGASGKWVVDTITTDSIFVDNGKSSSNTNINQYTYDSRGNWIQVVTTYLYSDGKKVKSITDITYDSHDNVIKYITTANDGTTSETDNSYTYDASGRISQEVANSKGSSAKVAKTYVYNSDGSKTINIVHTQSGITTLKETWHYDEFGIPTHLDSEGNGSKASEIYDHKRNDHNDIIYSKSSSYLNGQLIATSESTTSYKYSSDNKKLSAQTNSKRSSTLNGKTDYTVTTNSTYDSNGNLCQVKTTSSDTTTSTSTTTYTWKML